MKNLLILGAGGHGHVVAETAKAMKDSDGNPVYGKIDFLDDLKAEAIGKLQDLPLFKKNIRKCFRRSDSLKNDGKCTQEPNDLVFRCRC